MRLSTLFAGAALFSTSHGLNILLNNDDGFGSANLRETYRLFKEKGHNGMLNLVVFQRRTKLTWVTSLARCTSYKAERQRWYF